MTRTRNTGVVDRDTLRAAYMAWQGAGLDKAPPRIVNAIYRQSSSRGISGPYVVFLFAGWMLISITVTFIATFFTGGPLALYRYGLPFVCGGGALAAVLGVVIEYARAWRARRNLASLTRAWNAFDREFAFPELVRARYGEDAREIGDSVVVQVLTKYASGSTGREDALSNAYIHAMTEVFEPLVREDREQRADERAKNLSAILSGNKQKA